MIPVRGALWTLGAVVAAFLLWWAYGKYGEYEDAKVAAWQGKVKTAEASRDSALASSARTDTLYKQGETVYIKGRDILLHPGPGKPPATPEVKACFALSDSLAVLCAKRHDADTAALHATERELKLYQERPSGVQRVQSYGEALYDFSQRVPVIRAGATAKLLGPVLLSGAVEYSAPQAGKSNPGFRALVGARINF
jgi:hypothetical protein